MTNLTQYLDLQNRLRKDKIAVKDGETTLTFGELYQQVNGIGQKIVDMEPGLFNSPIIIFSPKSVVAYCAVLGVLWSGNYYVPIDIEMPIDRLKLIVSTLGARLALTSPNGIDALNAAGFCGRTIVLDALIPLKSDVEVPTGREKILDVDPAYLLFTSGSTGIPKGVVISHRAVIDYMQWQCATLHFDESTILANQAPFHFDASMPDIYTPLVCGATLTLLENQRFLFPNQLVEFLNQNQVNTLIWVPSALMLLTAKDYFAQNTIKRLRLVMFCGEVMPTKHLNIWRKYYPDTVFVNLYGPTETAYACTYYVIDRDFPDTEPLPIGKPCQNTEILILNEWDQQVSPGETGELCVRGSSLSLGYYGDIVKTNTAFVQSPLHTKYRDLIYRTGDLVRQNEFGEILYVGRKDFQIKHRGHRIELGEIEAVAYGIAEMEQCCAVYDEEKQQIILYCVLSTGGGMEKDIYMHLKKHLPIYMLPAKIQCKDTLPLNANGKIDRLALKNQA